MVHPVVRPIPAEAQVLVDLINRFLRADSCEIGEKIRISGKAVYSARFLGSPSTPGVAAAKEALRGIDSAYVAQQITRMETAVESDPALAIGTAKELIETCCRTILEERGVPCSGSAQITDLVKITAKALSLTPEDIPDKARASETIKRLLSNLGTVAQGIAELRNLYGTGHGRVASARGLDSRHAKLAVGAASTLAVFFVETHNARSV